MKAAVVLASLAVLSAPLYADSAKDTLRKAHKGDVVSMRQIGYMQFQGRGTKMDRKNGLAWLKRAAERGDTQAMFYLGCIYEQGIYVGQDKVEAEAYLSKAAKKGHNKAAKKLAEMKGIDNGKSNESADDKKAENKKKTPADDGKKNQPADDKKAKSEKKSPDIVENEKKTAPPEPSVARKDEKRRAPVGRNSQAEQYYEAGCNYKREGNNKLAIENYLKAAKLGHAESIYIIGRFWIYDVGDIEKGINALADAGEKGHAKANFALGQICSAQCIPVGLLMEDEEFGYALIMNESNLSEKYHDMDRAITFLRDAAKSGEARAQALLGLFYEKGEGVTKDVEQAKGWYKKAASQGYEYAAKALKELEAAAEPKDETPEIPDARVARKDEKRSAPVGRNSQAEQYYEAGCNYEQEGNNKLAIENYLKAAKLGHAESIYIIGRFWFYDVGDIEKGINALADAGKKGHAKANFALGQICSAQCIPMGLLMEDEEFGYALIMNESNLSEKYHDMDCAITFLRAAAKSGEARAQALLGLFYEEGEGVTKDVEQAKGWYKKAASQGYEYAAKALKKLEAAAGAEG